MPYYFEVLLFSPCDTTLITLSLDSKEDFEEKILCELEHRGFDDRWWIDTIRPLVGRPIRTEGITRVVPKSWAYKVDEIGEILKLIQDWRVKSSSASLTSRSWLKMRQFLKQVDAIGI